MVGNEKREPYSSITGLSILNLEPQRFIHKLNPLYRKLTQILFEAAELYFTEATSYYQYNNKGKIVLTYASGGH